MARATARWLAQSGMVRAARSLGIQLILILTGVGLAGALAITLFLSIVITPGFDRLEDHAVNAQVERTRAVLDDFARKVESAAASFSTSAMTDLDIGGMAYVGEDGRLVVARWIDPKRGAEGPKLRRALVDAVPGLRLAALLGKDNSTGFYLRLGDRLAAVGVARVRRMDDSGAARGYVLMARELTPTQLSALLQLPAQIDLAHAATGIGVAPSSTELAIAVPIAGPDGQTVASTRFSIPRDLSLLGRRMLMLAVIGAVLLLVVVLAVLRLMITRQVIRPLHAVEQHMGLVRTSGSLGVLPDTGRSDEIGNLVTSFNSMLRQLKDLREQVELQSFKLGKSESAVAVMHNVRNALNPVSTILSRGRAEPPVDRSMLDRAIAELAGEGIPPARRQKLAAFVAAAIQADGEARAAHVAEMETGRRALHNVLEIIGVQQQAAHERPQLAPVDLTEIVAQNAAIARYAGAASIAFSFPSKPHWCLGNRVILSQVVGNLFSNAAEAIAARGGEGGAITVTIAEQGERVELSIRDNGEGFDAALETKLFQRGFSTRAHKSGGLGLHWCANALLGLGGSLRLDSDGPGAGARAVLTLPVAVPIVGGLAA